MTSIENRDFRTHGHNLFLTLAVLIVMCGVAVQSPSHVRLFATPWTTEHQASLPLTISWSLPKFMSIALVMPSSHLILWRSLLLHSIFPSIGDFSNELAICIRWQKYWSFSFSISPSNEYSRLRDAGRSRDAAENPATLMAASSPAYSKELSGPKCQ